MLRKPLYHQRFMRFPSFRAAKEMFEMAQNPSGFYSAYGKINGEERK